MSDTLQVEARTALGSRNSIRLRSTGKVPATLYGHKEPAVSLSVRLDQLRKALKHNAKVVNLAGAVSGQALVQDLQWDTFHRDLLHLDLLRVDAGERVHLKVAIELRGDSPGESEGGMIERVLTHVDVEASPANLPEMLHVDISTLHLGGSLSVADIIDLPAGAKVLTGAKEMVVHCVPPSGSPSQDSVAAAAAEPEVVAKKKPAAAE
ncbi:MAG: 50S ribosomal protein L25 [Lacipirellulaceae bacterium]